MGEQLACPRCGTTVDTDWAFCPECGSDAHTAGGAIGGSVDAADGPILGAPPPASGALHQTGPPLGGSGGGAGRGGGPGGPGGPGGFDADAPFDAPGPPTMGPDRKPPFKVNRPLAIGVVVGALVLVVVIIAMTAVEPTDKPTLAAPGTALENLSIADITTTTGLSTTTTYRAPTTTSTVLRPGVLCDSKTSHKSSNGVDYQPCGGGFIVNFPGNPDIREQAETLPAGTTRFSIYTSTQFDQDVSRADRFAAVWGKVPEGTPPDQLNAVLEAAAFQLNASKTGDTEFQGMAGITFSGTDSTFFVNGIAFTDGSTVWALATLTTTRDKGLLGPYTESFRLAPETGS